jgi:hypothetical protein
MLFLAFFLSPESLSRRGSLQPQGSAKTVRDGERHEIVYADGTAWSSCHSFILEMIRWAPKVPCDPEKINY